MNAMISKQRVRRAMSPASARLILLSTAVGCTIVLLFLPRPNTPTDLPPLLLDVHEADQVTYGDRALYSQYRPTPESRQLEEILHEEGEAALRTVETPAEFRDRRNRVAQAYQTLRQVQGETAILELRAKMTEEAFLGLKGALRPAKRRKVLGAFGGHLQKYGAVSDGVLVAPPLVVRALYKARWNVAAGRKNLADFAPVERQAYWGWLALGRSGAETTRRLAALKQFEAAGGELPTGAVGVLAYFGGDMAEASRLFDEEYRRHGSLRFRNWALYAIDRVTE
ncbi:MAG: hypothetical protein AAF355_11200 [Myxococcota bacterium]